MKKNNSKKTNNQEAVNMEDFGYGMVAGTLVFVTSMVVVGAIKDGVDKRRQKKLAREQAIFNQFVKNSIDEHNRMFNNEF